MVAEAAAWMGNKNLAFEYLQRAKEKIMPELMRLMNPTFRNFRADPRWDEYLDSLDMSPECFDENEYDLELPE